MIDLNELLKPSAILVLDLLPHVNAIQDDSLFQGLIDPPMGIYIPNQVDPIISAQQPCYPKSHYQDKNYEMFTLETIDACDEPIITYKGKILSNWHRLRKLMVEKPKLPVMMIKVAEAIINEYLNTLCRYTRINRTRVHYDRFVKKTHQELVYKEQYENAFDALILELRQFIGNDTWHIYFTKMVGTSIIIEKTIDYRIYEWYQYKMKEQEDATET